MEGGGSKGTDQADGGTAKNPPTLPTPSGAMSDAELRAHAMRNHGRLFYRESMRSEKKDVPIVKQEDGFMTDTRCQRNFRRDDEITAANAWSIPPVEIFNLRGPGYLEDRVKYEADCPPAFECVNVEMLHCEAPVTGNIASNKHEYVAKERARGNKNFFLVINWNAAPLHNVVYFELHPESYAMTKPHLRLAWQRFLEADEETRNKKFKVIPSIRKGSWIVKQAVGQKPAIIGKALKTTYHEVADQYLEVDIDVNSSKVAQFMIGVVKGAAKDFVIDLGFLIEGQSDDELPEMLLGSCRLTRPNIELFATVPYGPVVDEVWRKQQKKHGLKPPKVKGLFS